MHRLLRSSITFAMFPTYGFKKFVFFYLTFKLVLDLGFSMLLYTAKYMHTVHLFIVQSIIIPMDLQRALCLPKGSVHLISS